MTKIKIINDGTHRIRRYRYLGFNLGYFGNFIYELQEYSGKWWREWKTMSRIHASVMDSDDSHIKLGYTQYEWLEQWLWWDAYERRTSSTSII